MAAVAGPVPAVETRMSSEAASIATKTDPSVAASEEQAPPSYPQPPKYDDVAHQRPSHQYTPPIPSVHITEPSRIFEMAESASPIGIANVC